MFFFIDLEYCNDRGFKAAGHPRHKGATPALKSPEDGFLHFYCVLNNTQAYS